MIPVAQITQWRTTAPWADDMQVEQDLILSRIIVEIFSDPFLKKELAFRGGTALHKLFFSPAARYSEDIDLVRTSKGPISEIADALRKRLEPWLGKAKTDPTARSFKMKFFFNPENSPATKLRIKIEINIEESFSILDRSSKEFSVESDWFSGKAQVNTFHFSELIATKLRALYQRSKGRDVFDLWLALKHDDFNVRETIQVFLEYMKKSGKIITKDKFEKNIELKLREHSFLDDIGPLLSNDLKKTHSATIATENGSILTTEDGNRIATEGWDLADAAEDIKNKILIHLPN
jgi:predicted nucleotidyltransferase component of viral defense system